MQQQAQFQDNQISQPLITIQELNEIPSGDSQEFSDEEQLDEVNEAVCKKSITLEGSEKKQDIQTPETDKQELQSLNQKLEFLKRGRLTTHQLIVKVDEVKAHLQKSQTIHSKSAKSNFIKRLVSKQKNRYELNGFDLDLTYITHNIIAMGFPAIDYESIYRNSMKDTQNFFNQRHPDHYKIYNLCSERKYPHHYFNLSVEEWGFSDHQAPPFEMINPFCESLHAWLQKDEQNVAGIHCKAGKGRTGIMICAYLLYSKLLETSNDVQRYYGLIRTKNRKGITIPSQIRYLDQYYLFLQQPQSYVVKDLIIKEIILYTIPNFSTLGGCNPFYRIQFQQQDYISDPLGHQKGKGICKLYPQDVYVQGDFLIQFFNHSFSNSKGDKLFQLWLNTGFITSGEVLSFSLKELDVAQDKKIFHKQFKIEIIFEEIQQMRGRSTLIYLKPEIQKKDNGDMMQQMIRSQKTNTNVVNLDQPLVPDEMNQYVHSQIQNQSSLFVCVDETSTFI